MMTMMIMIPMLYGAKYQETGRSESKCCGNAHAKRDVWSYNSIIRNEHIRGNFRISNKRGKIKKHHLNGMDTYTEDQKQPHYDVLQGKIQGSRIRRRPVKELSSNIGGREMPLFDI